MSMTGTVITFYSYKGGVGRSFALANIAVLLGRWGFRVLCIDWDLEAPGLTHFFDTTTEDDQADSTSGHKALGLVELLEIFRTAKNDTMQWRDHAVPLHNQRTPNVSLLMAGHVDHTYTRRLHGLDWNELYDMGLGNAFEVMFAELRQEYDYILIDARTGVTDFSGIITAQLPDVLAFMFTSNEQSFKGATDVARRAVDARNELTVDRSRLLHLPIPARFEIQFEHSISTWWQERFARDLEEFYEPWTPPKHGLRAHSAVHHHPVCSDMEFRRTPFSCRRQFNRLPEHKLQPGDNSSADCSSSWANAFASRQSRRVRFFGPKDCPNEGPIAI